MRIFEERELRDLMDEQVNRMGKEVRSEEKDKLLNVNEAQYVEYLVTKYQIEMVNIDFDKREASDSEKMIPAEWFPSRFSVEPGSTYRRQVITYHIPCTGNQDLLKYAPSTIVMWSVDVSLTDGNICFDVVNYYDTPESIRRTADQNLDYIRQQAEHLKNDVERFNKNLEAQAIGVVRERKSTLLKQANLVAALGIPLHKADQVPKTFAVPMTPKKLVVKPSSSSEPFCADPTLEDPDYNDILSIIRDVGVAMERLPSVYSGKDEEALRDYLIMILSSHYSSVTGETFNKTGKTDILIRHENANLFVAECKFWKGIKGFHETIDQILRYLTWRDSKAAVICFIQNKELNPVLKQIEEETPHHPCFVKYHGTKFPGWYSFEFHLKDDPTRNVRLAVLCFHFPPL